MHDRTPPARAPPLRFDLVEINDGLKGNVLRFDKKCISARHDTVIRCTFKIVGLYIHQDKEEGRRLWVKVEGKGDELSWCVKGGLPGHLEKGLHRSSFPPK